MSERPQTEKPSDDQTALDVQGALKRMGGRKAIYTRALQNFKYECAKSHEAIVQDLAAGDRETASRTAHSVKGVASTIGAVSLSQAAAELEGVIKHEDPTIDGVLEDFKIKLKETVRTVDGVLAAESRR